MNTHKTTDTDSIENEEIAVLEAQIRDLIYMALLHTTASAIFTIYAAVLTYESKLQPELAAVQPVEPAVQPDVAKI